MGVLDGKTAIITGSARGIGRAAAELLLEHGARVLINDLDAEVAHDTARELGPDTAVFAGDLTEAGVPEALVAHAAATWGRIDILVNNAGYALYAPLRDITDEDFDRMLAIHTVVPFRLIRAVAPHMCDPARAERERGVEVFRKIVNVTSISGTFGSTGQANYATAKAGLVGLTKSAAKEWGRYKINVNAVAFGWVDTRLTAVSDETNVAEIDGRAVQLGVSQAARDGAAQSVPLGRPATPVEAAGGIFYLCSPWSDYVQGQTLHVSGGLAGGMTG